MKTNTTIGPLIYGIPGKLQPLPDGFTYHLHGMDWLQAMDSKNRLWFVGRTHLYRVRFRTTNRPRKWRMGDRYMDERTKIELPCDPTL